MTTSFQVNGRAVRAEAAGDTPLLWVLRDELGMTGTKFGCGTGLCGACTVHIDAQAARACITPLSAVAGRRIATIEALEKDRVGRALQAAWTAHDVPQCGYCQSGQLMSATLLLRRNRRPSAADVNEAMAGNLCRCGTYDRIRAAILDAAKALA